MKRPFNTYTTNHGQTLPKSAIIQTSSEILTWLKENFHFAWANAGKMIGETKSYEEAFKKYLNWARKFPKKLVNMKFD